jgi:PAB1-binding protein PBP1
MAIVSISSNSRRGRPGLISLIAFRTDTDISQKKGAARERELQQWQPGADGPNASGGGQPEDDTFGPGTNRTHWDQFAANEKLFGVKTQFDENVYTTKLDRSGADFKEREREAQRIANEIIGVCSAYP